MTLIEEVADLKDIITSKTSVALEKADRALKMAHNALETMEEKDGIAMSINEGLVEHMMDLTDGLKNLDKITTRKYYKKMCEYFDENKDGKVSLEEGKKGLKRLFSNGYLSLFLGALGGLVALIAYNVLTMYVSGEPINWIALKWFGQFILPAFCIVLGAKPGYKRIMNLWNADKAEKETLAKALSQKEKDYTELIHKHELDLMEKDFQIKIKDDLNRSE